MGTSTKTQTKGDIDQEGLINNPKELESINISGVTK